MCTRVKYRGEALDHRAPTAQLPVLRRDGQVSWLPWGMRRGENHLHFFHGATAPLSALAGWGHLQPKPVRLPIEAIELCDRTQRAFWLALPARRLVRGVMVSWQQEVRVYIVTDIVSGWQANWSKRWPVLLEPAGDGQAYRASMYYPSLREMAPSYEPAPRE